MEQCVSGQPCCSDMQSCAGVTVAGEEVGTHTAHPGRQRTWRCLPGSGRDKYTPHYHPAPLERGGVHRQTMRTWKNFG